VKCAARDLEFGVLVLSRWPAFALGSGSCIIQLSPLLGEHTTTVKFFFEISSDFRDRES
jgi:hypothetical protein